MRKGENLPHLLVRFEGLAIFIASAFLYFVNASSLDAFGGHWIIAFVLLWLVPDVGILGYLKGDKKAGSYIYNTFHTYVVPVILGIFFIIYGHLYAMLYIYIWLSHIGLDRFQGYGLKYISGFKDTHIQKI